MIRIAAYLPDGRTGPGRYGVAELDAVVTGPAELTLPEAAVRDERGGDLLTGPDLVFDPAAGGGPLAGPRAERSARAFGLTTTAYHVQRTVRFANRFLERPLPRLLVRIGAHTSPTCWGGGHYRLPGETPTPEPYDIDPAGEIHLGGGRKFIGGVDARYFHAPAHNAAIVCHEVGHHICRHTADFRVNQLRPLHQQRSGKNALDEGTCDFLTAVLLGTPDVYGWHRGHIPRCDQRRRCLDSRWTMVYLRRGSGGKAHGNGTIWASALWSTRARLLAEGLEEEAFVAMVLRGLARMGATAPATERAIEDEVERRNQFSELLREILAADPALAPAVRAAMAAHGILPQGSNVELRERLAGPAAMVAT